MGLSQALRAPVGDGGNSYYVRDLFTTDLAAGSVNGSAAEPGPGPRILNDPDNLATLSTGSYRVIGQQAVLGNDYRPGLAYAPVPCNAHSKILTATITPTSGRGMDYIGFYSRLAAAGSVYTLRLVANGFYIYEVSSGSGKLGDYVNGVTYQVAVIFNNAGGECWVKGGTFTSWTKLHTSTNANTLLTVYPTVSAYCYNTPTNVGVDFIQVAPYVASRGLDYYFTNITGMARPVKNVLLVGDSKMVLANAYKFPGYQSTERVGLVEGPARIATSGWSTAAVAAAIDAALAARTVIPDYVMINLGANDVSSLPVEATWKANATYILDAIHTYAPNARIGWIHVWYRGKAAECNTLAGWLNTVIASRSSFAVEGPDERIFIENGDDGVTYTTDGIHYTQPGYVLACPLWNTALGIS